MPKHGMSGYDLMLLEMVLVNLNISCLCSKRKTSLVITGATLLSFSVVFAAILSFLQQRLPFVGNGSGYLMITGFIYLVPLSLVHTQPFKHTLLIMCSVWTYTLLVFSVAITLETWLPLMQPGIVALLAQSGIYVLTLPYAIKLARQELGYILATVAQPTINIIIALGFLWFGLALLLHFVLATTSSPGLGLIVLAVFALNVRLSYSLFYSLVSAKESARTWSERSKTDILTKLENREGLYDDAFDLIKQQLPFSIVFLDLDNFKSVNDHYGHAVGDLYLLEFVSAVTSQLDASQKLYRLSGDEFVLLVCHA